MFSQGCAVNTCLSSAPFWSGFGPKIRVASYLQDFLFSGVNECMVWDCESGPSVVFSSN